MRLQRREVRCRPGLGPGNRRGPAATTEHLEWRRISLTTWNTRALLTPDAQIVANKWACIARSLSMVDVLCAQEVHGTPEAMVMLAERSSQSHSAAWSPCATTDAGGVMTGVRRSFCAEQPVSAELAPGRILTTAFRTAEGRHLTICNLHNFSVDKVATRRLARSIGSDQESHRST